MLETIPYTKLDIDNVRARAEEIESTRLTCMQVLIRDISKLMDTPGWLKSAMIFRAEEALHESDKQVAEMDSTLMEVLNRRFNPNTFPITKRLEGPIAHERAHYRKTREFRPEIAGMESPIEVTIHKTIPWGEVSYEMVALVDNPKTVMEGLQPIEDVAVTMAPRVLSSMDVIRVQFTLKKMQEDGILDANSKREVRQLSRDKLVSYGSDDVMPLEFSELMHYVTKKKKG